MMKLKRILSNSHIDKRSIEDMVNGFFEQEALCKDNIVHISMDSGPDHLAFYIFYDDGIERDQDWRN